MSKYIIGIDSGTSVVKAAIFDMRGEQLLVSARNTPVIEETFGWSEYDLNRDWEETRLCLKELMEKAAAENITSDQIAAVGVGGKGQGVGLLDKEMKPLRNAILWNDSRCSDMKNEWIKPNGIMEQIHEISGNWLYSGNILMLLPWLKMNEKEILDQAVTITMPTSWLSYKMTDQHKICKTDMFSVIDRKTREISEEVFRIIDIEDYRSLFPEPIETWEVTGTVTEEVAAFTGIPAGVPVVNMGWDVVCCTAGVGVIEDGQANMIMGTSGVISVVMPFAPSIPKRLGGMSVHVMPGKWGQLIAPMTVTPNLDWFVDNFAYEDKKRAEEEGRSVYEIFDEEVSKVPVGANGVIYHPYMSPAGESAPFTNTDCRANFIGLLPHDNRYVMLRAIYEGVAMSFKHCIDAYDYPVSEIRLSGGGSNSPVWCQIMSDVCNAEISLVDGTEFGAKGVAWNAAYVTGEFDSLKDACNAFCKKTKIYQPNPDAVDKYKDLMELYKEVPKAMENIWEKRMQFVRKYDVKG